MNLVISIGGSHPATVVQTREMSWEQYIDFLRGEEPVFTDDKASRGWSCPAKFSPAYRDSENFIARYALTFDYDHISADDLEHIKTVYAKYAHYGYTTWSHTAESPRWRFVFPLSRPVTYDEFQAVSRKVASLAGIELAARESHVPAQMMFLPTYKKDAVGEHTYGGSRVINVDKVLASYTNWTDRKEWPHRKDGDGVQNLGEGTDPTEKPGIIGAFCRAYTVQEAIAKFDLPYTPTGNPDRWTYTDGTRPEGAIVYDDGRKLHSHHDSDPARGQNNAFDLVRLHRFGDLDAASDLEDVVTARSSYKAMLEFVADDDLVKARITENDFEDLGELKAEPKSEGKAPLARTLKDVLAHPTRPRWLLRDTLECATIALLVGPRGSYKSFIALDWALRVAIRDEPVYCVSAEGGDFDRRAAAWLRENTFDAEPPPLYVVERRLDLNSKESDKGIHLIRQDCVRLGIRPRLFVLDTFSKLSGGLDENVNSDVKQFIGRIDIGLKRAFDAAVLIVAHTGHSDATRARGASALEADTEAAHIVIRDQAAGLVTVSRERFKSSPELPPLAYRPKVVDLGRADEEGVAITSLVMEPVSELGSTRATRKLGKNQKAVYDTLKELGSDGSAVSVSALLDAACEKIPKIDGVRDLRRQKFGHALESLLIDGMVFKIGNSVSLTRATAEESSGTGDEDR